jgi:multicomponent Na+:H+ antiporter subunit D
LIIPIFTAALTLVFRNKRSFQIQLSAIGTLALLFSSIYLLYDITTNGIQVLQIGNWPAPFGITLVSDHLSAIMLVITSIVAITTVLYSFAEIDQERLSFGYFPVLHLMLAGVNGSFLTGDLFNLYVWFEVILISSFVLLSLGREKRQIASTLPYLIMNLISSAIFLSAIGILYSLTGALNFAELAVRLNTTQQPGVITAIAILFLGTFGLKSAIFPLFFWLPASYHTPPVAVSAIFAGLLTKVGVYALIRVFTLLFIRNIDFTHSILLFISGITMITGVLGAVSQNEFRKILSFHIISQIGYMLMGLALFTPLGIAGSIFYIVHHILVKSNLFFISGIVKTRGSSFYLKDLGGFYRSQPFISALFFISAFSLAGTPPLSGFWGKFVLVKAGIETQRYLIVATSLLVGLLTTFSMTKIWNEAFWKEAPISTLNPLRKFPPRSNMLLLIVPVAILASLTLFIGLFPSFLFNLALQASSELLNPSRYIQAVLGVSS